MREGWRRGLEAGPGGGAHLVRLRSRHGHDAADALGNGLLGDDDEGRGVGGVLQVAAGESDSGTEAEAPSPWRPQPARSSTHVPPQNSMELREPAGLSGSFRSSSTGTPMDTTRTGSG